MSQLKIFLVYHLIVMYITFLQVCCFRVDLNTSFIFYYYYLDLILPPPLDILYTMSTPVIPHIECIFRIWHCIQQRYTTACPENNKLGLHWLTRKNESRVNKVVKYVVYIIVWLEFA